MKQPAVYILCSNERGTLYVGVTAYLRERVHQHRAGLVDGFTRQHGVRRLVWYEFHPDMPAAIHRETCLKRWNRSWKLQLVEDLNPTWRDLWNDIA
jgi:putative endonuclease